jgi:putative serine protease PepD
MSSEDFPRNQDSNGAHPADAQQGPDVGSSPAAHSGEGSYENSTHNPTDNSADHSADVSTDNAASSDHLDTGPLQPVAPVWQPRPSGALAADAWSNPSSTAIYPSGTAGGYGTGQYRAQDQYGQYSEPRYAGYGTPAALGYAAAPGGAGALPPGSTGTITTSGLPPQKKRRTGLFVAGAVVLALVVGIGGGAIGAGLNRTTSTADSSLSQQTSSPVVSDTQPVVAGSVESVAAKLLPSVVSILSISTSQEAEGSGVILTSDGLILTNNHVIAGATDLTVKFNNGTTAAAKVVGADATDDLAVIKVTGVSGLTVATIGSSANVKVGEQVVAVGSPLGLSATVTSGIVSALNRPVRTAAEQTQTQSQTQGQSSTPAQDTVLNAIQTDAAINPGNSGGALVDMNGAVIGINSAIASLSSSSSSSQSGSIGVGFAIPIDQAHRIAQEIINTGHATHAVLGASVGDAPDPNSANAQAAAQAGLSVGAKIASVTSGGAAAGAGLQANDVITKIGTNIIGSADALIATIRSATPGGKEPVTYLRGTTTMTTTVTLGSAVSK